MKIETEKITLRPMDRQKFNKFQADQIEILDLFYSSYSIYDVARYFFSRGQLVSFRSILQVIEFLIQEKIIINPGFYTYFHHYLSTPQEEGFFDKLLAPIFETEKQPAPTKDKIAKVPFFRSLNPEVLKIFITNSNIIEVPAGITLCQEGSLERSLLVMLEGRATVFKKNQNGIQKKWVVLNESSLFGETGFFFGEPRTATVVTDVPSHVMIIKYLPHKYDDLIKTEKARELQARIWAIHALLKSETFKNLPQECFDALLFSGALKTFPANSLICTQGEIDSTCYIIVQGTVNVIKDLAFIKSLGQGESFGEIALTFTRGQRTATVQAKDDVLAIEIKMEQFYNMLSENLILGCEFEKIALSRLNEADN